jgi:hypothetical protein
MAQAVDGWVVEGDDGHTVVKVKHRGELRGIE